MKAWNWWGLRVRIYRGLDASARTDYSGTHNRICVRTKIEQWRGQETFFEIDSSQKVKISRCEPPDTADLGAPRGLRSRQHVQCLGDFRRKLRGAQATKRNTGGGGHNIIIILPSPHRPIIWTVIRVRRRFDLITLLYVI